MNRGTKKYKKYAEQNSDLDGTNYDNSEYIFSWGKDSPEIRADMYRCSNCNYVMGDEATECDKCGFPVSVYGYRELDYDYMDADGNEVMYETDNLTMPCDYNGTNADQYVSDEETPRKVRFDNRPQIIRYRYSDSMNNDDQPADDVLEHMDSNMEDIDDATNTAIIYTISHIVTMLLAYYIAYRREELTTIDRNGKTVCRWSMGLCIFFFPNFYLTYALVEWLTRPGP